jgi:hypothetical protein
MKKASKEIKQSVINTFNRVGIPFRELDNEKKDCMVANWITGATSETTELIKYCVNWVYRTSLDYEKGNRKINLSDFDRVRYFILDQDEHTYMACID